jgi:integrase
VPTPNTTLHATGKPGVYVDARGHHKISYTGSDGQRHWKWLGPIRLRDAVKAREALNVSIRRREVVVTGEAKTFAQVRGEYEQARTVRERTAESRDSNLRLYCRQFDRIKVSDIDKARILPWLGSLKSARTGKPLAEGTKAQVLFALSSVLQHAVDAGYIAANPCHALSSRQRPHQGEGRKRILSHDEEARLLAYCGKFPWLRPVITVARAQCLRLGEVAGLDIYNDVDVVNGKVRVHQQLGRGGELGPTKGAKPGKPDRRDENPIDLMPEARAALLEMRSAPRRSYFAIQAAFAEAVRLAGLPETKDGKVEFHSLRHTGISRLANHPKIPLVYVRDFAGHRSIRTTEGYVHRIESEAVTAAAVEAMAVEHLWNTDLGNTGNDGE